ncbi:MAG: hypothetical protein EOP21_13195 [Hyphomicrobiales bacterium]|nr:MAG: hypothetical protein EOP21_13195 [Hyphomicrobiales bacterium]
MGLEVEFGQSRNNAGFCHWNFEILGNFDNCADIQRSDPTKKETLRVAAEGPDFAECRETYM